MKKSNNNSGTNVSALFGRNDENNSDHLGAEEDLVDQVASLRISARHVAFTNAKNTMEQLLPPLQARRVAAAAVPLVAQVTPPPTISLVSPPQLHRPDPGTSQRSRLNARSPNTTSETDGYEYIFSQFSTGWSPREIKPEEVVSTTVKTEEEDQKPAATVKTEDEEKNQKPVTKIKSEPAPTKHEN